jgi:MarR family transcriptional regulator, temperature-dependent positive regulator of motility
MQAHDMPGHLIRRLHQAATQICVARAREAGFDVTPVQFAAMDALREHPEIDQATVAALIAYDRPTIGGVIERLVAKGLVEREINLRDRRARVLRLTAEGERTFAAMLPLIRAAQDEILTELEPEERAVLTALLRKAITAE